MSKEASEEKEKDDLDAIRIITETLKPFKADEQERIIRWTREKLGLSAPIQIQPVSHEKTIGEGIPSLPQSHLHHGRHAPQDIKTFVTDKKPISDQQFAAVIAYYYKFEVSEAERKDAITGDDLIDACRKASRPRLKKPIQTLRNACVSGLLDKGKGKGSYGINTVGENLVAMTLPASSSQRPAIQKPNKIKKKATKKARK